jgi:hypothetical protein
MASDGSDIDGRARAKTSGSAVAFLAGCFTGYTKCIQTL